jgi:hypothetical protein
VDRITPLPYRVAVLVPARDSAARKHNYTVNRFRANRKNRQRFSGAGARDDRAGRADYGESRNDGPVLSWSTTEPEDLGFYLDASRCLRNSAAR